jgi:hypothetical protein
MKKNDENLASIREAAEEDQQLSTVNPLLINR